jgi:hypothetical protein
MAANSNIAIDTVPLPERTVNVRVSAKTAYDLAAMGKVTASILGRLGCPRCHSGWDIRFDVHRHFAVDDKLNVTHGLEGIVITDG